MKKTFSILLALLLCLSWFVPAAQAAEQDIGAFELPAPQAPNYFFFTDGDAGEGHHDDLRMYMVADPAVALLAAEYDRDSDAFREKYGLWSFEISMQYDVSLDDEEHWQHNAEWDTNYYNDGIGQGYPYCTIRSEMVEDFEFFWLTYYEGEGSDTFVPYQPAITSYTYHDYGYDREVYSFDTANHTLYIRCRYYMEWEPVVTNEYGEGPGEKQSKFSDWSESAVFGRNSTQIIPEAPDTYEAPVISDLKIVLSEGDENSHLEYVQTTPESAWMAYIRYEMMDDGEFDGLETQVSINGGEWVEFSTADAGDDWCLWNGSRAAYGWDYPIAENSWVRLRVRFNGTHGPSEWSNVLEVNGGGTVEVPQQTGAPTEEPAVTEPLAQTVPSVTEPAAPEEPIEEKCGLCGFCPMPLGLCIVIWIAIVLAVVLVLVILLIAGKNKCPNCKTKYRKGEKFCAKCGHKLK